MILSHDELMELAETNGDWAATSAIYEEETEIRPLPPKKSKVKEKRKNGDRGNDLNDNIARRGFSGCLRLTIGTTNTAFCRKVSEHGHYRYFSVKQPPVLKVIFHYEYNHQNIDESPENDDYDDDDDDDFYMDDTMVVPKSLRLEWEEYPNEWPIQTRGNHLEFLQKQCDELLKEEQLSFPVVEFCEHEALSFWETIHDENEYRLVLLPPVMDSMYHSNTGTKIHPLEEGKKQEKLNSTKRSSKGSKSSSASSSSSSPNSVDEYARIRLIDCWKSLYSTTCPICFDDTRYDEGVLLPNCGHFFCNDCFPMYLKMKVTELGNYRTNPFLCPLEKCRDELPIVGFVKQHITKDEMETVRGWIQDIKYPKCHSLDRCLSKHCNALDCMRRRPKIEKLEHNNVFCDVCDKTWCELCLKRVKDPDNRSVLAEHYMSCDYVTPLKFCRRYMNASDETLKQQCEEKYPWVKSYALSRKNDSVAMLWLSQNGGQCCPNCRTGIERTEGCFHMQCPTCATHFCYECGETLHPPYYGTHHCWEQNDEEFALRFV